MLEEWKGKQVKLFLLVGKDNLIRTGRILETSETLFTFKDQYGNIESFAISAIQQIQEVET